MPTPEQVFLRYAFPCAQVLLDTGKLTKEGYERLKRAVMSGEGITRDELESIFRSAVARMKELFGEDYWSLAAVREYFIEHHNRIIDAGKEGYANAPEYFKEMCKVHIARVVAREGSGLRVRYGGKERVVLGLLCPEAKPGDKVSIHLGFAIEVLA
ncbi:hypothetical protein DRJ48_00770 [Candidatus Woesearchaeota archaeon]|nr:HypC/HybG/HupF family hydrogenase formation chaperone [Candidatus Woesearchaeota archaeon]RLE43474.1 MAG: hypothetical protein DRJ48_00770 [Candidatus Woesearchaeota archaeon]